MPDCTVEFDSTLIQQNVIDKLKAELPAIIASALNAPGTITHPSLRTALPRTPPGIIKVKQSAYHPTDVNVPPLNLNVVAGEAKGRNPDLVAKRIAQGIANTRLIPLEHLSDDKSPVWLHFSTCNGFCPIPC